MNGEREARAAPSLGVGFVRRAGGFDRWGDYHYMAGNLGPYLFEPPHALLDAYPYLFPVSWLVAPSFGRRADGGGLAETVLAPDAAALLAEATYSDAYNGARDMRAFVPFAVLTSDCGSYGAAAVAAGGNPHLRSDPAWAASWAETAREGSSWRQRPGMIERGTMGTGFSENTLPSDGSPAIGFAAIEMTDGSLLAGWAMTWANK